tara:strand:+ start:171 stop:368 length:198 start_codon:yes stop_codon:yes gene_type:complete
MKRITKEQILDLIASIGPGKWSSHMEKTGHGDYGKREVFSFDGRPVVAVEINYTEGGKATAYDMR